MSKLNNLQPIQTLRPFTRFCSTIGNLPSSYMQSLTYEEQLMWLCNYLETTVIPAVNQNAEVATELQNLYTQLKNYIDNYFTNLDVQNEINNKLDQMVEDGTLQNILNEELLEKITVQINANSQAINNLSTANTTNQSNISNLQTTVANNSQTINTLQGTKANNTTVTDLQSQVNQLVSGNPKGSFPTLTDLQNAYPNGTNGIFIVQTNKHWYYYNNGWKDGGLWQTAELTSHSIQNTMLDNNARQWLNTSTTPINIHPTNKTVELTQTLRLACNDRSIDIPANTYSFDKNINGNKYLIYNLTTLAFEEINHLPGTPNSILIASIYISNSSINSYYIASNLGLVYNDGVLVTPNMFTNSSFAFSSQPWQFTINPENITIQIPYTTMILGNFILPGPSQTLIIPNTQGSAFYIKFNRTLQKFDYVPANTSGIFPSGIYLFGINSTTYTVIPLCPISYTLNTRQLNLLGDSMFYDSRWTSMANRMNTLFKIPTPINNGMPGAGFVYKSSYANNQNYYDKVIELYLNGSQFESMAIIGGTNDFDENIPLGDINSTDITTFAGMLNTFIPYVCSHFTNSIIKFFSPIQRFDMTTNSLGLTLLDYVNMYERICQKYHVDFVNLYNKFPVNQFNYSYWLRNDKLHPTDEGFNSLASLIYNEFKNTWYGMNTHA